MIGMPRIGVDARLLSRPLTGVGRYTHEIVNALLREGAHLELFSAGPIRHPLEAENGHYRTHEMNLNSRIARLAWSEYYLPRQIRQVKPDVFLGAAQRLPRLPAGVPGFLILHDLVYLKAGETMRPLSRRLDQIFVPRSIARAKTVVASSENTAREVREAFPAAGDIVTIYPGVSGGMAAPRGLLMPFRITKPYILFVGTLEPRKNLRRLVEAYAGLPEAQRAETDLVIAGGAGWGDVDLQGLITETKMEDHVRLTGYVDEAQLATLYAHCEFLAMPSLYEGFGLPLIEAMAHGRPVLTSNAACMPEIAGNAGVLVDPLDVQSIRAGLRGLLNDDKQRATLARRARRHAARFTWEKTAQSLLALFDDTCPKSRG